MLSGYDDLQSANDNRSPGVTGIGVSYYNSDGRLACRGACTGRSIAAIVHEETYHDYTPEDIDRLYAYKESLPENKQFIFENNKETLAQVFTDVRYKKEDNEVMSENLWKVIKKQGF